MKSLSVICLLAFLVSSCSLEERREHEMRKKKRVAEEIQSGLLYFKDKRTGLCFVYFWGGSGSGGPALTLVPEEKVAEFLINK